MGRKRSGGASAPAADVGEYASYCARIHDEEIYHDLCAVKNSVRDLPPVQPPAFNTVGSLYYGFCFFILLSVVGGQCCFFA